MKIINRGFITVRAKSAFWDWANNFEDSFGFKKIFINELSMVNENEEDWPQDRTQELFLEWFHLELGSSVFDLEKSDLKADKL